jgi:hypothetical protein
MTDKCPVVEQNYEIQSLTRKLEWFKCILPNKFVAGDIIAKFLPG